MNGGLTADEVRDLFSAYHDRELPPDRSDAVRAALEADEALNKEYAAFCRMLDGLGAMADAAPAETAKTAPPDLLAGVQSRLKKRSGGRYYADRWSRVAGIFPLELLAALVLIALVGAYFAMTAVSPQRAPQPVNPAPAAR